MVPLDRLAQHPLGALLTCRDRDGFFYHLPRDFRFPLPCRDPIRGSNYRHHVRILITGYMGAVLPAIELPSTPHEVVCVDRNQARARLAMAIGDRSAMVASNADLLDAMTSEVDGLRLFAAMVIFGKRPARFPEGDTLEWNWFMRVVDPSIPWEAFPLPS